MHFTSISAWQGCQQSATHCLPQEDPVNCGPQRPPSSSTAMPVPAPHSSSHGHDAAGAAASPFTPPGTSALAAICCSPLADISSSQEPHSRSSSNGAAGHAPGGPSDASVQARAQAFMLCVLRSPLVAAALLRLEVTRSHPVHEGSGAAGLQCTLAQMLALHLRAQCDTASEPHLLALLWVLEAWGDATRSRCTDVLYSYLQHLPECDLQLSRAMGADWVNEFLCLKCAMIQCQADLLQRLSWAVRIDTHTGLAPCLATLFPAAPAAHILAELAAPAELAAAAMPAQQHLGAEGTGSEGCPARLMQLLCWRIEERAALLAQESSSGSGSCAGIRMDEEEERDSGIGGQDSCGCGCRPAKRCRHAQE